MKKSHTFFMIWLLVVLMLSPSLGSAREKQQRDDVKVIRYNDGATIIHGCPGEGMRTVKTSASLTKKDEDKKQEGNNILIYDCQNTSRRTRYSRSRRNEPRIIRYDSNATISYVTPEGKIRTPKTSGSLVTKTNKPDNILIYDTSRTNRTSIPGMNNRIGITSSGLNITINQNITRQRSSRSIILK